MSLFIHTLYLPLLASLRRFLLLPYTYPHSTAKLLLSSSMPFQVRPSISTSLSSTGCVLLFIFSLYHPTSPALPPFSFRFSFCTGWGVVLSVPQLCPQVRPSVLSSASSSSTDFFLFLDFYAGNWASGRIRKYAGIWPPPLVFYSRGWVP